MSQAATGPVSLQGGLPQAMPQVLAATSSSHPLPPKRTTRSSAQKKAAGKRNSRPKKPPLPPGPPPAASLPVANTSMAGQSGPPLTASSHPGPDTIPGDSTAAGSKHGSPDNAEAPRQPTSTVAPLFKRASGKRKSKVAAGATSNANAGEVPARMPAGKAVPTKAAPIFMTREDKAKEAAKLRRETMTLVLRHDGMGPDGTHQADLAKLAKPAPWPGRCLLESSATPQSPRACSNTLPFPTRHRQSNTHENLTTMTREASSLGLCDVSRLRASLGMTAPTPGPDVIELADPLPIPSGYMGLAAATALYEGHYMPLSHTHPQKDQAVWSLHYQPSRVDHLIHNRRQGSGKTATLYACAQELEFAVMEINSSDSRSGRNVRAKLEM
ncbi:uncharacterized protein MONBRDRAFT_6884 [Monosiga brevicollis MX1]|uniref:Uncharacterized protein n=1 Tax=Monosiga brevicollis TaxID=81824 RepID=A9UUJ1_MONBE|nr:uncharacterized protein MONBRDRAFT_6884 [Monosiga brevicollis MX1]EDQ90911.1 predicted protein [Monosiga brevicollis MX1]|eukprot:XP_001744208.1 hypothetical protein [Monosiga brevicollis MX1]